MITNSELRQKIDEILKPMDLPLWGVGELAPSLPLPYTKALVVVVPYAHMITLDEYNEPFFRMLQLGSMARRRQVMVNIADMFRSLGVDFKFPPHTEEGEAFETKMTEIYCFKDAGRRAGLGWIGKSSLLITREYGPRITMAVFLVNDPLEADKPVEQSFCGSCEQCSKNCAFRVLHNQLWHPGITREEQVDYIKCSHARLAAYEKIGRKIACGKCVVACPHGTRRQTVS